MTATPRFRPLPLVLVLVLVAALGMSADAAAFSPTQIAAFEQAAQREMAQDSYPGMMLGVWSPGQGEYVQAFGVSDLSTGTPLQATQPSRIGSITKTFTGTLVMQLVEKGQVRLDDPLSDYVRGIPRGRAITIRELLNHTSGNPDTATVIAEELKQAPQHHFTPSQIVRWSAGQPRACAPGKCWFYSNLNFYLLGRVVEKITHRPLTDLYRRRIFDPLGLDETEFRTGTAVPAGIAHGYDFADGVTTDLTNASASWIWTAGAMVSTLQDLRVWAEALASGDGILNRRTQRQRLTFVETGLAGVHYGLGLAKFEGGFIGHNGTVPGYAAMLAHNPTTGTTIVVLGTTSPLNDISATGAFPAPALFELLRELKTAVSAGA